MVLWHAAGIWQRLSERGAHTRGAWRQETNVPPHPDRVRRNYADDRPPKVEKPESRKTIMKASIRRPPEKRSAVRTPHN